MLNAMSKNIKLINRVRKVQMFKSSDTELTDQQMMITAVVSPKLYHRRLEWRSRRTQEKNRTLMASKLQNNVSWHTPGLEFSSFDALRSAPRGSIPPDVVGRCDNVEKKRNRVLLDVYFTGV